ncbi:sulfotransferase family protein [Acidisoma sp. C75]
MVACWLFFWKQFAADSAAQAWDEAAIFARLVLISRDCLASKLAILIGPLYWVSHIDIIPNRVPVWGYSDQIGFCAMSLVLARLAVPRRLLPERARQRRFGAGPRLQPVVVFCHCPKTAGTSLFRALSARFGHHRSYLMRRQRPDLALLQRRGFALVSGHAPYGWYRAAGAINSATLFVTFCREPRAVLLSRFAHFFRHRADLAAGGAIFAEPRGKPGGGAAALRLFLAQYRALDGADADNPQTRFAADHFLGPLQPEHFRRAQETMAAMGMVGLTERFEESLQLLAYRLGWREIAYHRLNVSRPQERLGMDAEMAAELDRHLAYDDALVAWAKARFERDYAAMLAECAARGVAPPAVRLAAAKPPFRAPRARIAAASTLLFDDWCWWLGARLRQARRAITALPLSRLVGAGARPDDPDPP